MDFRVSGVFSVGLVVVLSGLVSVEFFFFGWEFIFVSRREIMCFRKSVIRSVI